MTNISDTSVTRPQIHLLPGRSRRFRSGHPWIFSNEIVMSAEAKALPPGGLATIVDAGGERLGVGTFNPHSLIAVRVLSRNPDETVDQSFLALRLRRALALRDRLYDRPFYRLIHAEADGLPGLVIDRYGDIVVLEANTAGMEMLLPALLAALDEVLAPSTVLLQNDGAIRKLEGLELYDRVAKGEISGPIELEENGAYFFADLVTGQKTGWFFDQRDNRAAVAAMAKGRSVIDFYSYAGGFAIQAALAGAGKVVAVDRSEGSLALAAQSAERNGVVIEPVRAEAFAEMERLKAANQLFGVVIADPPAFVKSKKDLAAGSKGYRKMVRLAAGLVEPGGVLMVASCSHHMGTDAFAEEVRHGLSLAGREGRILRSSGAGADHPLHPFLPESAYLKALLLQLD
ncbi:class I SAM-dependent rRNA methyltransferase [Telmatospirillum siberiense]|uniref:RlmI/RlmK family 23S rRNA methyltransferase n=1 Tax=Telmatospirillum siberiense TaxID=382514 RepID=A0A2N3Q0P8_9PROT|nr:class I SAM-dependent rRNA methyltransferase [Telmatospirillum siberiense]PKU26226.1 RlmI/RlmK family 23S rRNA methyltransferase [Telmatospirillum siberiense]